MDAPQVAWLPGGRLHLNHGPIDLVIGAYGARDEVDLAYHQAIVRFETVLGELVAELAELRRPATRSPRRFRSCIAQAMENAASLHSDVFVTPMAAVAGAVADEMLASLVEGRNLAKAYVNDGGDIALVVGPGEAMDVALAEVDGYVPARLTIRYEDKVRGIATSGWRGRSQSLGIADAVTVLAATGAEADVAATLIANAVDLPEHPSIERRPSRELAPDSDLGPRLVTTGVGALTADEVCHALDRGQSVAEHFIDRGTISGAALFLQGTMRICDRVPRFLANSTMPDCAHA